MYQLPKLVSLVRTCSVVCGPYTLCLEALYLGKLGQTPFCLVNLVDPVLGPGDSSLEHVLERREPRVNLQDA